MFCGPGGCSHAELDLDDEFIIDVAVFQKQSYNVSADLDLVVHLMAA